MAQAKYSKKKKTLHDVKLSCTGGRFALKLQ